MSVDFEAFTGFGTGGDYMPADTVDEQASDTGMSGYASIDNRGGRAGGMFSFASPSGSLVMLWFISLGLYWFLGHTFRRARS